MDKIHAFSRGLVDGLTSFRFLFGKEAISCPDALDYKSDLECLGRDMQQAFINVSDTRQEASSK